MRNGANLHAWYGKGITVGSSPYNDAIVHVINSGTETVELCPTYGGANAVQSSYPLCSNDYDPGSLALTGSCTRNLAGNACYPPYNYVSEVVGWDWELVNDPSVVLVNGTYYLYFDAPRTGPCDNGTNNQIFAARSTDGVHWTNYPSSTQYPVPAIPYFASGSCGPYNSQGTTDRYGIGEPSVVYKSGKFYMYHTNNPWMNECRLERVQSFDGVSFNTVERVTPGNTIESQASSGGGVEVRYIPGWDLWLMIVSVDNRQGIRWNISRDGIHWLPATYKAAERTIPVMNDVAYSPALEADPYGWIGDSTLTSSKATTLAYTTGVLTAPLTWDVAASSFTMTTQPAFGNLDSVSGNFVASGWSYDPDAGTNDAASNGSASAPLGHDIWVRPIATSVATGTRYEGTWQSAQLSRSDLVSAGVTPDPYHGFSINLLAQAFPSGMYDITVQAGEFPVGAGGSTLTGSFRVTIP